ncbi:peptide deformylase [Candidatus Omnitrophota bacterium]
MTNNAKHILEIKKYPEPGLRKKSSQVFEITPKELKLFEDMLLTMYTFNGVGLAAPQVGNAVTIIVADVGEGPIKIINPHIVKSKGEDKLTEGCLSVPELSVDIRRPEEVLVEGLNEKGEHIGIKAKGLLARVIQHEMDHLRGRLIIDYLSMIDKMKLFKSRRDKRRNQCK